MKKKLFFPDKCLSGLKKLLLVMKLTTFLVFLSAITIAANSYSQNSRFNLRVESKNIVQVFDEIELLTDYGFLFKTDQLDVNKKYTLNLQDASINEVMNQLLDKEQFSYKFIDRTIVISRIDGGIQSAKQIKVSGKVTDSSGSPLPGVTVVVKGTTNGTITNFDGVYSLSDVPSDGIIQFSFVGMKMQEISVAGKTSIDIVMEEDAIGIEEVVAVGYGTQKKVNLTGSVQSIKFSDAVNNPVTNSAQLMYGKFSGIQLTQNSGLPGSDGSSILIRGMGTFGSSTPLVVIDGIEFDDLTEFNRLSPSDIEDVTVLKDASSGAIYGARGANGVILISTKKGKEGKFNLEYNGYSGFQKATVTPKFLDAYEYAIVMNDMLVNRANGNESAARYTQEELQVIKDQSDPGLFANTNWVDILTQNAPIQNHNLTFSGGDKKTKYLISGGYLSQGSIIIGTFDYDRYNLHANINSELNKWIKIENNLFGSVEETQGPTNYSSTAAGIVQDFALSPTIPVKYDNGLYGVSDGSFYRATRLPNWHNPVESSTLGKYTGEGLNINNRFNAIFTFLPGLSFETAFSVGYSYNDNSDFRPNRTTYAYDGAVVTQSSTNSLSKSFVKKKSWQWNNILRYKLSFKDNDFNIIAGHTSNYNEVSTFSGSLEEFPTENLFEFNAGGTLNPTVGSNRVEETLESFFGRINYVFKDRYLFEANVRRDGSSRFGVNNHYATFPSFSLGWRISEEPFIKNLEISNTLNQLKLRASWGRTGNDRIGNYIWERTYTTGLDYVLGSDALASGAASVKLANTDIKWETTEQYNIGLDASFFNNKLSLTADYFNRRSFDVLYNNFPVPATLGVTSIASKNSAEVLNKGVELGINYQKRKGKLYYNIGVNVTKMARNKVVHLGDGVPTISGVTIVTEGEPYKAYYGYQWLGIFQSDEEAAAAPTQFGNKTYAGDVQFADVNGPEGIPDGIVDANDRVIIGDPYPEWIYNANVSVSYGGIDFNATFQGLHNVDRFVQDNPSYGIQTRVWNAYSYWIDRWTPENPSETLYRLGANTSNNIKPSAFYVEDGSYLRLKNLEIGYSLPKPILARLPIEKIRFFISGQNLITFTKMNENLDPERELGNTSARNVPIYKVYSCGLNVTF